MSFFRHIDRPAKVIVRLLKTGREAREVVGLMPGYDAEITAALAAAGRNDPCPCGSGQKVKKCHGQPSATFRAELPVIPLGIPRPPVARVSRGVAGAGVGAEAGADVGAEAGATADAVGGPDEGSPPES